MDESGAGSDYDEALEVVAWRTATRKAGLSGRHVHDLRRTAVRKLERAGVPRSRAMKSIGHRTEAMYQRYAIVSEGDLDEAVDRLSATIQPQVPTRESSGGA